MRSSSAFSQSSMLLIPKESKCMAASIEKVEKRERLDGDARAVESLEAMVPEELLTLDSIFWK
jgi:hypothetical protein